MKKTVMITGCSSGFGLLAALKFHYEGWQVIGFVRKVTNHLKNKIPDDISLYELDITNKEKIRTVVSHIVKRYEIVDVLINNAGVGSVGLFEQHSDQTVKDIFDVNVFGTINMTREILPHMRKRKKGVIINMSSIRGLIGCPHMSVYASSKFALQGFSESLAIELKPFNIKVKTIVPGSFATNFGKNKQNNTSEGDKDLNNYSLDLYKHLNELRKSFRIDNYESSNPMLVANMMYQCATTNSNFINVIGHDALELIEKKKNNEQDDFYEILCNTFLPVKEEDSCV